jgi:hypothetical protein
MRATDIIRELLCLIDVIDNKQVSVMPTPTVEPMAAVAVEIPMEPVILGDEDRRFKQIFDILSREREGQYANSPTETIAGIESVTTDAGLEGVHPADLRVKDPSMYPNFQDK